MIINNQKRRKKKYFFNNQKGMALITTLIFIFVLVSLSVALLIMTSNDSKLSTLHRESIRAFYLAETGVDKALWYLNTSTDQGGEGLNWRTIDEFGEPVPLIYPSETASEYYEFTVLTDPFSTGDPEIIVIKSTGKVLGGGEYDKGTRIVEAKLEWAISPSEGIAYNHAILTYGENSDLKLHGHTKIIGDIHSNGTLTGSGVDPDKDIIGKITSVGENNLGGVIIEEPILKIFLPNIDWGWFEKQAASQNQVYQSDTSIEFNDAVLNGIHYIKGDVVIKNSLQVNGAIIVEGEIKVQGNPDIVITKSGGIDIVMAAKGNITLGGNAHINGIIHSEENIKIDGNINIDKGAIFARDGVINGTGADLKIVYDPNLAGKPVPGTGTPVWKIASWREVY